MPGRNSLDVPKRCTHVYLTHGRLDTAEIVLVEQWRTIRVL